MKSNKYLSLFYIILASLFMCACAKQVEITGGQRDTSPPVFIYATPPLGSTNFAEKKIKIRFDEYIRLNNVNQKLIVSPPLKEKPSVKLSGKSIYIHLNPDDLQTDVTYYFNFNDAIVDNNEGNVLNSFVYAFATGDAIDSLSISGRVFDAFTKTPIQDALVLLYDNLSDSAVYTQMPKYLTKVDKDGFFMIPFIRQDDYKIFALKDNNFNYLFDLPNEGIAFLDTIFRPDVEIIQENDTSEFKHFKNVPDDIELLMFYENNQAQFIKSSNRISPSHIELIFNSTQYENYSIRVFDEDMPIIYAKENPDTINIWLQNADLINEPVVRLECRYTDILFPDTIKIDSINLRNKDVNYIMDSVEKIQIPTIKDPEANLNLFAKFPIKSFNPERLILEKKLDSTFLQQEFRLLKDSLNPLKLVLESDFAENSQYRIITRDSLIENIYGLFSVEDTCFVNIPANGSFGKLNLKIPEEKNFIVQLLQSNNVYKEAYATGGICEFLYLRPGTYRIRMIEDTNENRRWDTGDLKNKLQPEKVYYYISDYEIKANWTHELEWNPTTKQEAEIIK